MNENVMNVTVVAVEHSLLKPNGFIGDPTDSTLFHRGTTLVPVLHLFGYTPAASIPPHVTQVSSPDAPTSHAATPPSLSAASPSPLGSSLVSVCVHLHGVLPYFYVPCYDPSVQALQFQLRLGCGGTPNPRHGLDVVS